MAIQYGPVQVSWLGHDGFLLESQKKLYVDPYQIEGRDKPEADYVLITHNHYDHMSIPDVERVLGPHTIVVCPPDCSSKISKLKFKQLKTMQPGDVYEDGYIKIEAVPAYNKDKTFHPHDNDWLGYVITMEEVVVYHAGDTDFVPEMKKIKCNVALLPVSGTYVMNAEEAAKAADAIKPDVAIPMHYGSIIGSQEDAEKFKKLTKTKVVILDKE
jgi:L-ascorbate metabolism protein UlaG (beta-lactamase superfamily)